MIQYIRYNGDIYHLNQGRGNQTNLNILFSHFLTSLFCFHLVSFLFLLSVFSLDPVMLGYCQSQSAINQKKDNTLRKLAGFYFVDTDISEVLNSNPQTNTQIVDYR